MENPVLIKTIMVSSDSRYCPIIRSNFNNNITLLLVTGNTFRKLIGQFLVIGKLQAAAFSEIKRDFIGIASLNYICSVIILRRINYSIFQKILKTCACRCLRIRHIDNKCHAVIHLNGQSLLACERRKRYEQPVTVCLLL